MLSLTTSLRILESTASISLYKMKGSIHLPAVIPAATSLCKTVCIHMHTGTHHHDIVTMNHAVHNQFMLTIQYERPAPQRYNSRPDDYMYYEERERPLPRRAAPEAESDVYEPPQPEIKVESVPVPMPPEAS
ncbi:hypothetical protein J4E83_006169 [Alternaria metachromatica]|uniref:uncharacterized protein n=1 Tax=Alternaria metachromatica TaxID=283354 RepID=UPI0020C57846|nr:uncharacterized protein J4E83_006169 [Alternaria metachromatica]KAI4617837.1 hypothetical protein J4E83_006169 [Alternaria metachromatica]